MIRVTGKVAHRPDGTKNPKLDTGEIELRVKKLELLNKCHNAPFLPTAMELPGEDLRLTYRYLDLRRPEMQRTLKLRSDIIMEMRNYFAEHGFIDVETPILGRSTPEGARDYLVPSRVHNGLFYALPQSPQLYKQILMVAGYDRYVQVARCFRDEDLRADRQPEFTQLDMEMSFVTHDDVMSVIDGLMQRLAKRFLNLDLKLPLPRMTWDESMERFGHDAPDLRFGCELIDCTDIAATVDFRVFKETAEAGKKGPRHHRAGRGELLQPQADRRADRVRQAVRGQGPGLVPRRAGRQAVVADRQEFHRGAAGQDQGADAGPARRHAVLHRRHLGGELQGAARPAEESRRRSEAVRPQGDELLVDRRVPDVRVRQGREPLGVSMHHPFTAPRPQDVPMLDSDPGKARAVAYDLVINGSEAGGGTIRIHDQATQARSSACWASTPRRPRTASASCSTPCKWALRRTAASPWASTAS